VIALKITEQQHKIIVDALDDVVKKHGIACLNLMLPLLSVLQEASPEIVRTEPAFPKLVEG
jgi:hypothetical protein